MIIFSRAGLHGEGAVFALTPDDLNEDIKRFGFNKFASDRIPFNRTLPDVRHKECPGIFLCNILDEFQFFRLFLVLVSFLVPKSMDELTSRF